MYQHTAAGGLQHGAAAAPFAERFSKSGDIASVVENAARFKADDIAEFLAKAAPAPGQLNTDGMLSPQMQISYGVDFAEFLSVLAISNQVDTTTLLGKYFTWTQDERLSVEAEAIQAEGPAATVQMGSEQKSFDQRTYGARYPVTDLMLAAQGASVGVMQEATQQVTAACLRRIAKEVADSYFTSAAWGLTMDGAAGANTKPSDLTANANNNATHWSDAGRTAAGADNSHPIDNIMYAQEQVYQRTGGMADTAVFAPSVQRALRNHPGLLYRIAGGQTSGVAMFNDATLATALDLRAAVKGNFRSSASAYALGNNALLTVRGPGKSVNSRCGLMVATFGPAGTFGVQTRVYRDEAIQGVWVEARVTYDVVQPDRFAGVFFNGIVA